MKPLKRFVSRDDGALVGKISAGGAQMRRRQRSIHPPEWSKSDQKLLKAALYQGGRRYQRGAAHGWSAATVRTVLSAYCCSLGWLDDQGLLDWNRAPAVRWPEPVIEAYIDHLQCTYAKATVYNRLSGLERGMAILEPDADRGLLRAALSRLGKPRGNPVHERRVQSSADLLQLGLDLMQQADVGRHRSPRLVASLHRTGLQISLLALRFWRISEFQRLEIGRHIRYEAPHWTMDATLPDQPSKKRMRRGRIPDLLAPHLERHIQIYRPLLCDRRYSGDTLWVSMFARPQSQSSIRENISGQTALRFGRHVNPHLFRKCAVTTMAVAAPKLIDAVSRQMGHTGPETRDQHYNLATSLSASNHWNNTVEQVLHAARDRRRLRRRP